MKLLGNEQAIELLENEMTQFSNGLDQYIHGSDYDILLGLYHHMENILYILKKDKEAKLEVYELDPYCSYHVYDRNSLKIIYKKNQKRFDN